MNPKTARTTFALIAAAAVLSLTVPSSAQQQTAQSAPAVQQAPAVAQAAPAQTVQAPAPSAAPAPATASPAAAPAEREGRLMKAAAAELRELSPWSMFKSADVLVKAVMLGLAF